MSELQAEPWWRAEGKERGPTSLWSVLWNDGRVTILPAADLTQARIFADARLGQVSDGWPSRLTVERKAIAPVPFLRLDVAAHRDLNKPKHGHARLFDRDCSWSGPYNGFSTRERPFTGEERVGSKPTRLRMWAYVVDGRELVVFTAPDFDSACCWVIVKINAAAEPNDVEPVERIELHLSPQDFGLAPSGYRLWIDGCKVGWPPVKDCLSDPPPTGPLPAEACLQIPTYSIVDAYAPGLPKRLLHFGE